MSATPDPWQLPQAAREFMPHRPPMQLVERLLVAENGNGEVETVLAADSPLTGADGRIEEAALVELIAQAYAAVQGYCDLRAGRQPGRGFLVGIRQAQMTAPARCGERLRIAVRTQARVESFAMVEGEVHCGERLLASAVIKLWLPGGEA